MLSILPKTYIVRHVPGHTYFPILSFQFCPIFFSFLFVSFQFALSSQIRNMSSIYFFRLSITLFYDSFKRFYVEKVGVLWATLRVVWVGFFFLLCTTVTLFFFFLQTISLLSVSYSLFLLLLHRIALFLRYFLCCCFVTIFLNNKKGFAKKKEERKFFSFLFVVAQRSCMIYKLKLVSVV